MGNKISKNQDLQLLAKRLPVCPSKNKYIERGILYKSKSSLKKSTEPSQEKVVGKSVRFSTKRRVKKIPHVSMMSAKTIEDCWFGPKCNEEFEASYRRLLYLTETGGHIIDEKTESIRGLEDKSLGRTWEYHQCKQNAYDAVKDEQERQCRKGVKDPHNIARLYSKANKNSTLIAIMNAQQDEFAVQEYLGYTQLEELKRKLILHESLCIHKRMKYSVGISNEKTPMLIPNIVQVDSAQA